MRFKSIDARRFYYNVLAVAFNESLLKGYGRRSQFPVVSQRERAEGGCLLALALCVLPLSDHKKTRIFLYF